MPLYDLPALLVLALALVLGVTVTCAAHVLIRRAFASTDFVHHNEVAGFIIALVGVVYAVLLGFVTIVVWQEYDASGDRLQQEASAAADLWTVAPSLPPATGRLRADVRAYVDAMLDSEWPAMRHGTSSPQAARDLQALAATVAAYAPRTPSEEGAQQRALTLVQKLGDLRRYRLHDNETALPRLLWVTLFVGGLTTIGFMYLFGMHNFRVQLLMTAAVTIVIVSLMVVIAEFDLPFRSDVAIPPTQWRELQAQIRAGTLP